MRFREPTAFRAADARAPVRGGVVAAETQNAEDGRCQHQVSQRPAAAFDLRLDAPGMQLKLCAHSTKRRRRN
jgi:hypothetical protein